MLVINISLGTLGTDCRKYSCKSESPRFFDMRKKVHSIESVDCGHGALEDLSGAFLKF